MSKPSRNDACPCGSGKKYKKCCLAETFVQVGKEESIRKRLVDELLDFYNKNYRDTVEETHSGVFGDFSLCAFIASIGSWNVPALWITASDLFFLVGSE